MPSRFPNTEANELTNIGPQAQLLAITEEVGFSSCPDVVATLMNYYEKEEVNAIVKIEIHKEDFKYEFRKYGSKVCNLL